MGYYCVTHWLKLLWLKRIRSKRLMKKKKKILDYNIPGIVGSLGSVSQYAKAKVISRSKAQKELEKNLAYTLHNQHHRRGVFQPVVVFDIGR